MTTSPTLVPTDFCYPTGTISVDEALSILMSRARAPQAREQCALADALGRVLASDVSSAMDVPGYDNSQMDGFALRVDDVGASGAQLPVSQRIAAGQIPAPLAPMSAARIFTGAAIPQGADAVVMQERCEVTQSGVRIPGNIPRGDNIRPRGNDLQQGALVLRAGVRLQPRHLGLLASLGQASIDVRPRLRVAVFSCGDELREPGETLAFGEIYNSNRHTLVALIRALGQEVVDLGRVGDNAHDTRQMLATAARSAHVVVSSGGMSVGEEDHVKSALMDLGQLELWRVAVKPGKPLAYGRIDESDFLGLPGNPVSTLVTFCWFVRPFLLRRMGVVDVTPRRSWVRAAFDWPKAGGRREFARARLVQGEDGSLCAQLHPRQGSDVMSSTTWADGLVEIPEGTTVARGDMVSYIDFDHLTW